jgi:hypothetical protein
MSSRASSFGDRSSKGEEEEKKVEAEVAMASIKDADNGEHSESQRERDDHRIPEV